jgi:hypothetical protein
MHGSLDDLNKALDDNDYNKAGELSDHLRMAVSLSQNLESMFFDEILGLLDRLLDLADQLFTTAPADAENHNFKKQLKKASELLCIGTVETANEATSLIESAIKTREQRLQQLVKIGYYDRNSFCVFWKLWRLLDETLRHPSFPAVDYVDCASRLYGTITSALRSREAVVCLAKFSADIFPDEKSK